MKQILGALILSISMSANAADFTIEFNPAPNSVGNTEVSSLTSSKITDFTSSAISALTSTLSSYFKKSDLKKPTIQRFLSGSGTYTTPAGVLYIEVEMVAGGGGGASASTSSPGTGHKGGNSTFGQNLLVAEGGFPGAGGSPNTLATCSVGPEAVVLKTVLGTPGGASNYGGTWSYTSGSEGGSSPFGGNGGSSGFNVGKPATPNTGSGGGGGGVNATPSAYGGSGGSSGCYIHAQIPNPLSSYQYSVGAGGAGASGAQNLFGGGAGGSGIIIVKEYYQ